jgi:thioesterase domain-containing protein
MVRELDSTGGILARSGPIVLRPDAAGSAFFFVHGGDGEVLSFAGLARAFGTDRTMYGVRAQGIDDGATPCASIEEMAAGYVDAVRSIQQHGPYALGGFCLGATVALEMAHQLVAAGEAVPTLVLVDPRLPVPGDPRYRLWLAVRLLRQRRSFRAVLSRTLRPRRDPAASWMSDIERQIARMRESYEPKAYFGPASLILSSQHEQYDIPEWHLRRVIRDARTVRLDLDHARMLQSPGVNTLAREMRIALGLGVEGST